MSKEMFDNEDAEIVRVEDLAQNNLPMQIEKAQVDIQIATAKQYPRNLQKVKKEIIEMATMDEETAESCFFSLPRAGRTIQGESVRLAEIVFSAYGNMRVETNVIETVDRSENPYVVVQARVLDLEKNVARSITKRRRITKKKRNPYPDEDDITLAINAASAIAFRDVVLKTVPKTLIRPAYKAALSVATGGNLPIEARIAKAFDKFASIGVLKDRILLFLEKEDEAEINQEDLEKLIGVFNAIRQKETTIEAEFPRVKKEETVEPKLPKPEKPKKKKAKKEEPKPEPKPEPAKEEPKKEEDSSVLKRESMIEEINEIGKFRATSLKKALEHLGVESLEEATDGDLEFILDGLRA